MAWALGTVRGVRPEPSNLGPQASTWASSSWSPWASPYKHSRPYHPQTCGKAERSHHSLEKWLAKQRRARSVVELQRQLERSRAYYNQARPHRALGRRTSAEAFAPRTKAAPRRAGPRAPRTSRCGVTAPARRARSPCATAPSSCTSAWAAVTPGPERSCSSPTATCASSPTTLSSSLTSALTPTRPTRPRNDRARAHKLARHVSRHPSGMSRDTTPAEGVGFEPTGSLRSQGFSRASHSAALPSLLAWYHYSNRARTAGQPRARS